MTINASAAGEGELRSLRVSWDARHLAWAQRTERGWCVARDGVAGPEFGGEIECWLSFSPDSRRFGYAAHDDKRFRFIVDDREESASETIAKVVFSADSAHAAYAIRSGGVERVVVDGTPQRAFTKITGGPAFLTDGRVAYGATDGASAFLVLGESATAVAAPVVEVATSAAGGRIACVLHQDDPGAFWIVLVDGIERGRYQAAGMLRFSRDGAHLACAAKDPEGWHVVADGSAGPALASVGEDSIVWSPEGGRLAYTGLLDSVWSVFVDGVEHPRLDAVGKSLFEQDDIQGSIAFSPHGTHVAWVARDGPTCRLILDGAPLGPRHPAAVYQGGLVAYDGPAVAFGPDERHVAFVAEADDRLRARGSPLVRATRLVIDDAPGSPRLVILSRLAFDGPTTVRYVELRRPSGWRPETYTAWRVTETLR